MELLTDKRKTVLVENIGHPLGVSTLTGFFHLTTHEALGHALGSFSTMEVLKAAAYEPAGMAAVTGAFIGTEIVVLKFQEVKN